MSDDSGFYPRIIGPIEDRMIRAIWRIARNGQDAEDALQDALLAIWKRRDRIGRHATPQALVLKICIDATYDVVRRRARRLRKAESVDLPVEPVEPALSPRINSPGGNFTARSSRPSIDSAAVRRWRSRCG